MYRLRELALSLGELVLSALEFCVAWFEQTVNRIECLVDGHWPPTDMLIRVFPEKVIERRCARCMKKLDRTDIESIS